MFLERLVSRLRAAHALSFAMAAGQKPGQADLEAAGLDGDCADFFNPSGDRKERPRQQPVTVASDAPPEPAPWDSSPATEAA